MSTILFLGLSSTVSGLQCVKCTPFDSKVMSLRLTSG